MAEPTPDIPGLPPGLGEFLGYPSFQGLSANVPGPAAPPQGPQFGPPSGPAFGPPPPVAPPVAAPPPAATPRLPVAGKPQGLLEGLPAMPPLPKRIPAPEPPKPKYSDPIMGLGKPLALIALLGSLFTRRPAIDAMNALASASMAQRQGDQAKYENDLKEYQTKLAKVREEQTEENNLYRESMENRKMTFDERHAAMQMTAARRHDSLMTAALNGTGGGPGGNMTPTQILEARMRAGKPVTEAEIKALAITDAMKKNPNLSFVEAAQAYDKGKLEVKAQVKDEHSPPAKPLSMTQQNAADVEARRKKIMSENPGIDEDVARSRALAQHNADNRAPPGAAWATLDPVVQNVVTAFPEAREKLANESFKLPPARQANLIAGLRVVKENDRVAEYIAENPEAVGVLPLIYNRYHSTLVSKPTVDFTTPEEAGAYASKIADQQASDIRSLGGKMILPDGRRLDPGLAEKAAILNKMLIQTGLSDAAQMSASGRGGTIYLDKLMSEKIYNQQTNPYVLLNFLADRSSPAVARWKELDSRIDLASPNAPAEYRSLLLTPGGIEALLGQAYPSRFGAAPSGGKLVGTTPDGKPVYEMPDGSKVVPR